MYFDPLSAWLVALIADGIVVAGEVGRSGAATAIDRELVKKHNEWLNADVRRVKKNMD